MKYFISTLALFFTTFSYANRVRIGASLEIDLDENSELEQILLRSMEYKEVNSSILIQRTFDEQLIIEDIDDESIKKLVFDIIQITKGKVRIKTVSPRNFNPGSQDDMT